MLVSHSVLFKSITFKCLEFPSFLIKLSAQKSFDDISGEEAHHTLFKNGYNMASYGKHSKGMQNAIWIPFESDNDVAKDDHDESMNVSEVLILLSS